MTGCIVFVTKMHVDLQELRGGNVRDKGCLRQGMFVRKDCSWQMMFVTGNVCDLKMFVPGRDRDRNVRDKKCA